MKLSTGDRVFYGFVYGWLILVAISCLFPILHVFALSFSSSHAAQTGIVSIWPVDWSIEGYKLLFEGTRAGSGFINSLIITIVGVILCVTFTVLAAYPLSRKFFYARRFFTLAIVFTMIFKGGLIPTYILVNSLGLVDTYWSIWFLTLISAFNMLIVKTYFERISEEIEEAARIDGAGEWRLLIQVIFPVSLPVLATVTLFYGVGLWNSFMNVMIYINQTEKQNLTVIVQQMIQSQSLLNEANVTDDSQRVQVVEETLKAAGVMIMVIPMLLVYPFLQKYFVKGVMLGSVKG